MCMMYEGRDSMLDIDLVKWMTEHGWTLQRFQNEHYALVKGNELRTVPRRYAEVPEDIREEIMGRGE